LSTARPRTTCSARPFYRSANRGYCYCKSEPRCSPRHVRALYVCRVPVLAPAAIEPTAQFVYCFVACPIFAVRPPSCGHSRTPRVVLSPVRILRCATRRIFPRSRALPSAVVVRFRPRACHSYQFIIRSANCSSSPTFRQYTKPGHAGQFRQADVNTSSCCFWFLSISCWTSLFCITPLLSPAINIVASGRTHGYHIL